MTERPFDPPALADGLAAARDFLAAALAPGTRRTYRRAWAGFACASTASLCWRTAACSGARSIGTSSANLAWDSFRSLAMAIEEVGDPDDGPAIRDALENNGALIPAGTLEEQGKTLSLQIGSEPGHDLAAPAGGQVAAAHQADARV